MSDRILRLQHVEVRCPDLELATAYYTEVVGLTEAAHEEGRVFLKCWDEHEHHSVVLRQAPTYGLDHMSFKLAERDDLDYYARPANLVGIAPPRLDHIFIMAEDVEAATAFFRDVLDFRLTEQIIANDGH